MSKSQQELLTVEPIGGEEDRVIWSDSVHRFVVETAGIAANKFKLDNEEFVGDALQVIYERVSAGRFEKINGVNAAVWNLARDYSRRKNLRGAYDCSIKPEDVCEFIGTASDYESDVRVLIDEIGEELPILIVVGAALDFGVSMKMIAESYGYTQNAFKAMLYRKYQELKERRIDAQASLI